MMSPRYDVPDLAAVEFIGLRGVDALVRARQVLRSSGGDLALRAPSRQLTTMLGLLELTDLLEQPGEEHRAVST